MDHLSRRLNIVAEARSWVGTPFRHQARVKGHAVDCANLIIGVGEACDELWLDPALWRRFQNYGRLPNPRRMAEAMAAFLCPIDLGPWPPTDVHMLAGAGHVWPGDVVWLQWRDDLPMHLAILGDDPGRLTIIHALYDIGKCVEHGYVAEWPGRAHSWWRFPGLAA